METLDLITLAIPRPCAPEMIKRLVDRCKDFREYKWRWTVNVDRVEGLEKVYDYDTVCTSIEQAAKEYDLELTLYRNDRNIGHAAAYRKVMEHVQGDFLYLEDDKFARKDFTIAALRSIKVDQLDIEFPHNKIGHTGGHFGSARYGAYIKSIWPLDYVPDATAESYLKKWFFDHPHDFTTEKRREIVVDEGSNYLRKNNIYRRWKNRLALMYYVAGPSAWLVTWAPDKASVLHFMNYAIGRLNSFHSFPLWKAVIYTPCTPAEDYHPYRENMRHAASMEDAMAQAAKLEEGNIIYVQWSFTIPDKWYSESFDVVQFVSGTDPHKLHCHFRKDASEPKHLVLRKIDDQHNNSDTVKE